MKVVFDNFSLRNYKKGKTFKPLFGEIEKLLDYQ